MTSKIAGVPIVIVFFILALLLPVIALNVLFHTANQKRFEDLEIRNLQEQNRDVLFENNVNTRFDNLNQKLDEMFVTPTPTVNVRGVKPVNN